MTLGVATSGTQFTLSKAQFDSLGVGVGNNHFVQIKANFVQISGVSPHLDSLSLNYLKDNTSPTLPSANVIMWKNKNASQITSQAWTNNPNPYFTWSPGNDLESGIKGYCLYLGDDPNGDPSTSIGLLGTSPSSITKPISKLNLA